MPGTSFDRVADIYDETRGGQRRGDSFAAAVAPWLLGPRVVELGIGTGTIATGLRGHGLDVVGVDLSEAMLRKAVDRIGPRVAIADVDSLPVSDDSVDTALFVWVLQLVDDPAASLREAARIVRTGGRVVALLARADDHPDDEIAQVLSGLAPVRRRGHGADPDLVDAQRGLELLHHGYTPWDEFPDTVADQLAQIEGRQYSSLFDLDDETWTRVVVPVLDELRAFSEPERIRTRRNRHPIAVWTVAAH